jgi:hypothetical protein
VNIAKVKGIHNHEFYDEHVSDNHFHSYYDNCGEVLKMALESFILEDLKKWHSKLKAS